MPDRITASNKIDQKRYSYHKVNALRKGGKWCFQIIDFFGLVVHESPGKDTQSEARREGKVYRDAHYPKKS